MVLLRVSSGLSVPEIGPIGVIPAIVARLHIKVVPVRSVVGE